MYAIRSYYDLVDQALGVVFAEPVLVFPQDGDECLGKRSFGEQAAKQIG